MQLAALPPLSAFGVVPDSIHRSRKRPDRLRAPTALLTPPPTKSRRGRCRRAVARSRRSYHLLTTAHGGVAGEA